MSLLQNTYAIAVVTETVAIGRLAVSTIAERERFLSNRTRIIKLGIQTRTREFPTAEWSILRAQTVLWWRAFASVALSNGAYCAWDRSGALVVADINCIGS